LQHAWLRRLWSHIEPHARGEVEPGGSHKARILQKDTGIPVHGLRERSVVIIPAQLFGTSSIVLLSWGTWVGSSDPCRPICTVGTLVDLLKVEQACSLLLEVSKHAREDLGTVGRILADGWVLADGSQEVGVSVGCIPLWEELVELGLGKDLLNGLDI